MCCAECVDPVEGVVSLPEEFHNAAVTRESHIAVLLPSSRGPGLCSYILLQFLIRKNNDFLHTYCPLVKQQSVSYSALFESLLRQFDNWDMLFYFHVFNDSFKLFEGEWVAGGGA